MFFLVKRKITQILEDDKTYPVFAQKCNLKDGDVSLEQARFLDPSTINKWNEVYKLQTGDILVNSTGTGTVGRTRLFNTNCLGNYPFVVPDSHVSVVRVLKVFVLSIFMLIYLLILYNSIWKRILQEVQTKRIIYWGFRKYANLLTSSCRTATYRCKNRRVIFNS